MLRNYKFHCRDKIEGELKYIHGRVADPNKFELLGPDPHSKYGSGPRREKIIRKNRKKSGVFMNEVLDVLFGGRRLLL
jgi:hypothetical protein